MRPTAVAALCPKWINIRRGCYILTVLAIVILPWHYVTNPGTFIAVLSGWSVFLSPMTGILVSDSFLIRKGQYHLGDLYVGDSRSAYWYSWGFNFRAFLAWVFGTAPLLRTSRATARVLERYTVPADMDPNSWLRACDTRHRGGCWLGPAVSALVFLRVLCVPRLVRGAFRGLPPGAPEWEFPFRARNERASAKSCGGWREKRWQCEGDRATKKKNRRWDFSGCVSTFTPGAKV